MSRVLKDLKIGNRTRPASTTVGFGHLVEIEAIPTGTPELTDGNIPICIVKGTKNTYAYINGSWVSLSSADWLFGNVEPINSLGKNGDFYLQNNFDLYRKDSNVWGLLGSLRGPGGGGGTTIHYLDASLVDGIPGAGLGAEGDWAWIRNSIQNEVWVKLPTGWFQVIDFKAFGTGSTEAVLAAEVLGTANIDFASANNLVGTGIILPDEYSDNDVFKVYVGQPTGDGYAEAGEFSGKQIDDLLATSTGAITQPERTISWWPLYRSGNSSVDRCEYSIAKDSDDQILIATFDDDQNAPALRIVWYKAVDLDAIASGSGVYETELTDLTGPDTLPPKQSAVKKQLLVAKAMSETAFYTREQDTDNWEKLGTLS